MEGIEEATGSVNKEEICVHIISPQNDPASPELFNYNLFEMRPFRETYFRYAMYGLSEVVKSTSFVYASHHASESAWLDIKKLSIALVGNSEIPNLGLFAPVVKEVYFMGHIAYPTTAFNMLTQLESLETVSFNIGFGGYSNDFRETMQEFHYPTKEVPSVTSLEIKLNLQLYQTRPDDVKSIFNSIVRSVIKHSSDSFPSLNNVVVDLPNIPLFHHSIALLLHGKDNLRNAFEIVKTDEKIQVRRKPSAERSNRIAFDQYAYFPTNEQYNSLRLIDIIGGF